MARLFRVIVPVPEIEAGTRFYRAVLDMPGARVSGGRHYFDCGGTILACFSPRDDGDDFDVPANPEHLYFAVGDLEQAFERCRARVASSSTLRSTSSRGASARFICRIHSATSSASSTNGRSSAGRLSSPAS